MVKEQNLIANLDDFPQHTSRDFLMVSLAMSLVLTPQSSRYVREPDAITVARRVTTRIRSSTRAAQALLWMALVFARESHFA